MSSHLVSRTSAPAFALAALACAFSLSSCARSAGSVEASGTIEATEIRVASKVAGQILSMPAKEGAALRAGDPVAFIDHSALDLQLGQADAGIEAARAQLDLLLVGARSEDLAQAEAAVDSARESARIARADSARTAELFSGGSATQKQKDDADARAAQADAQERSAAQALKKLESAARPEELRAAKARLEQAEWAAKAVEKQIEDCAVKAPIAGVVSRRLSEPGELAAAGSGLVQMTDLGSLTLTIYVAETDLASVSLGQSAAIRVDSAPGKSFAGTVSRIASRAEFTPKNVQTKDERVKQVFAVTIDLGAGEGTLKPGMPADASLGRG
jgi:HlyD family secretion protein